MPLPTTRSRRGLQYARRRIHPAPAVTCTARLARITAGMLCVLVLLLPAAAQARSTPVKRPHTALTVQAFHGHAGGIPGWRLRKILATRAESNWQAWRDSHESGLYFYPGSWGTLGRTGGSYGRAFLSQGMVEAEVVALTSTFQSEEIAQAAYGVVLHRHPFAWTPLRIGAAAAAPGWPTRGCR